MKGVCKNVLSKLEGRENYNFPGESKSRIEPNIIMARTFSNLSNRNKYAYPIPELLGPGNSLLRSNRKQSPEKQMTIKKENQWD